MASFQDHLAAPAPYVVDDGLQARADWEMVSRTSPSPPPAPTNSPQAYSSSSDDEYENCLHARLLCDQRYADLQALMAELERSIMVDPTRAQRNPSLCRSCRSSWSRRRKSWLVNFKRAFSLRRRKSQETRELDGRELEPEWPEQAETLFSSPRELSAVPVPAELQPSHTFISELAASPSTTCPPGELSGIPAQLNPQSSGSAFYIPMHGYNQAQYPFGPATTPIAPMAYQQRVHDPYFPASTTHVPSQNIQRPIWYSIPPTASFTGFTPVSPSPVSTLHSNFQVSPQPSVSSTSSSGLSNATTVVAPEGPLFATEMESSPVEYGDSANDTAPWAMEPVSRSHESSLSTLAELPGTAPGTVNGTTPWVQRPAPYPVSELENTRPFMNPPMPSHHQQLAESQPVMPFHLGTGSDLQHNLNENPWQTPPMMSMEERPAMPTPSLASPYFRAQPRPIRPGPRPLVSQGRQHSYDSTASTILDVPMAEDMDTHSPQTFDTFSSPHSPPVIQLPSQQKAVKRKPAPAPPLRRRRTRTREGPDHCEPCKFYPDPGAGQRRKLEKHRNSDDHRTITGQGRAERYACPVTGCGKSYNREDNMKQHVRKKHPWFSFPELDGARGEKKLGCEGCAGVGAVDGLTLTLG